MKKTMYAVGTLVLALAMGGLPAISLAREGVGEEDGGAATRLTTQSQGVDIRTKSSVRVGESEERQKPEESRVQIEAISSSDDEMDLEDMLDEQSFEDYADEIHFDLEDEDDVPAVSLNDLKKKIEMRKQQFAQEAASTTPDHRNLIENANPVRVAVHSLLDSRDLLGGIGPKVSEIAKDMNNSVSTTTNAEAKIQSRGFFMRLFFGGDSAAADVIAQQVAQNQQRIDGLNKMLGEANVPADIQATLHAQITAIQEAQTRLQDLAQREQNQWGLFSWRF